jgi:crotonobetainyl-CoA:carnitine CoA-transferase CaiB-like acyl-CoA transferase
VSTDPAPPVSPPLAGLLVADFTRVLAGPVATMTLGDLGADVVKVEPPDGDDTRHWGPPWWEDASGLRESTYATSANRNKRSVVLDLRVDDDLGLARELARRADVVVHNFRPGTAERLGLDHGTVAATNPRVVTCSISGFGSTGPGARVPGYDLLVQAAAGWMAVTGDPDGPPTKVGFALADLLTGQQAVIGILAALATVERDDVGQLVEVALFDAAMAGLVNVGSAWLMAGLDGVRAGNRHPSLAPYQPLRAGDGEVVVAVGSERLWLKLCEALDRPDLAADPRFATNGDRVAHVDELVATLEVSLSTGSADEWVDRLLGAGVPAGRVHGVAEAFAFADALERDLVIDHGDGLRTTRSPVRLSRTPTVQQSPPPRLGADDVAVRAWLRAEDRR